MTAFQFRPAVPADLDALEAIENAVFEHDRLSRRSLRYYIQDGTGPLVVATEGDRIVGYALVALRRGTALARLYSIALLPGSAGRGLGGRLLAAAEQAAAERGAIALRLEVRADNGPAIRLYERMGYHRFGRYEDYYEDHADALRYEKRLIAAGAVPPGRVPPFYAQTTDFSCGPACLLMARAWAEPGFKPDRAKELMLWREATTIFMTSGLGGCEPYGLAAAAAARGLDVALHLSHAGPFFLDGVRSEDKRAVMRLTQDGFRQAVIAAGVPVMLTALDAATIATTLDGHAVAVVLISGYRMFGSKAPHWVLAHGYDGRYVFIHDPWIETEAREIAMQATSVPIPMEEFLRMARYGRDSLRAAVVIRPRGGGGRQG